MPINRRKVKELLTIIDFFSVFLRFENQQGDKWAIKFSPYMGVHL